MPRLIITAMCVVFGVPIYAVKIRLLGKTMIIARVYTGHPDLVAEKAKRDLGWVPEISVEAMCAEMVAADLVKAKRHAFLKQNGYENYIGHPD